MMYRNINKVAPYESYIFFYIFKESISMQEDLLKENLKQYDKDCEVILSNIKRVSNDLNRAKYFRSESIRLEEDESELSDLGTVFRELSNDHQQMLMDKRNSVIKMQQDFMKRVASMEDVYKGICKHSNKIISIQHKMTVLEDIINAYKEKNKIQLDFVAFLKKYNVDFENFNEKLEIHYNKLAKELQDFQALEDEFDTSYLPKALVQEQITTLDQQTQEIQEKMIQRSEDYNLVQDDIVEDQDRFTNEVNKLTRLYGFNDEKASLEAQIHKVNAAFKDLRIENDEKERILKARELRYRLLAKLPQDCLADEVPDKTVKTLIDEYKRIQGDVNNMKTDQGKEISRLQRQNSLLEKKIRTLRNKLLADFKILKQYNKITTKKIDDMKHKHMVQEIEALEKIFNSKAQLTKIKENKQALSPIRRPMGLGGAVAYGTPQRYSRGSSRVGYYNSPRYL